MALTQGTMIPELWSARLLRGFDNVNVYANLFTNVSSEISDGDRVNYSKLTTEVTVGDYQRYTDIADPQDPDDEKTTLILDKAKYFNIEVDDLDAVQARPAVMDEFARKASVAVADQVNSDFRTVWLAGAVPSGHSGSTKLPADDSTSKAFIEQVFDGLDHLNSTNVPREGRFMVMHHTVETQLLRYLALGGLGTGVIADAAFRSGILSDFLGINVVVDNTWPDLGTGKVMAVIDRAEAVYYARQISSVEAYRPEKRFTNAVKGLYNYGAKKITNDNVYRILQAA